MKSLEEYMFEKPRNVVQFAYEGILYRLIFTTLHTNAGQPFLKVKVTYKHEYLGVQEVCNELCVDIVNTYFAKSSAMTRAFLIDHSWVNDFGSNFVVSAPVKSPTDRHVVTYFVQHKQVPITFSVRAYNNGYVSCRIVKTPFTIPLGRGNYEVEYKAYIVGMCQKIKEVIVQRVSNKKEDSAKDKSYLGTSSACLKR